VQLELLQELKATGVPLAVVLVQGRPHAIPWVAENADALLCAWYPGEQGGQAVAEALFGLVNPAGRLPISVPRSAGQLPVLQSVWKGWEASPPDWLTANPWARETYDSLATASAIAPSILAIKQFDTARPE
jgi:hypothetical protein